MHPRTRAQCTRTRGPWDLRPNRLAGEELTLNDRGKSIVSYADHAIAMVDEAEKGEHVDIEYMMPSLRARRARYLQST